MISEIEVIEEAYKIKDNVPESEKVRRREVLIKVLIKGILENSKKYIGKKIEVLVSEHQINTNKHFYIGKTRNYRTVKFYLPDFKSQDLLGKIAKVKIIDVLPWGLKGKIVQKK